MLVFALHVRERDPVDIEDVLKFVDQSLTKPKNVVLDGRKRDLPFA